MPGNFTFTDQVTPICELGLGSTRSAEPTSWFDVSCYVHESESFDGRERFNERFQPGTASITFDNRTGWGDLVGDPFAVADAPLRPGRPIRIGVRGPWGVDAAPLTRWLWRGWIDQAQPAYDPTLHDVVTVNCIDALGEAGQTIVPFGPTAGINETVDERIIRTLDGVGWFPEKRIVATSPTRVIGTQFGSPAIDEMSVAADSAGGVVYGDTNGNIVYKDLDWAYYDPDLAHDGEIGNCDPGTLPIPGSPPYLDPTPGPVYDPAPPIPHAPPVIEVCITGAPAEGTVVEQGDAWRIFVSGGHLWYESSGHLFDMGPWTSANECTSIDTSGPTRTDPGIAPFPGIPAPWPFIVEFLGYSDAGIDDGPQSGATVGGLAPGNDCLLVVLINAICDNVTSGSLAPFPVNGGSVSGGGLTWEKIGIDNKSGFDGAESYAVAAEVGRTAPGAFNLAVDWSGDHQSRSHIVTVWKVTGYKKDMFARMKTSAYLHAGTHDQPESVLPGGPPGKGPTTIALTSADPADLAVAPATRLPDIAIAQSLAESPTPPFGAEFGAGTWWTPAFADGSGTGGTVGTDQAGILAYVFPYTANDPPGLSTNRADYAGSVYGELFIAGADGSLTSFAFGAIENVAWINNAWINDLPITYRLESNADGTVRLLADGHLVVEGTVPGGVLPPGDRIGWGNQWTRTHYVTGVEPNDGAWQTTAVRYSLDGVTTITDDFERVALGTDWVPGGDVFGYTHFDPSIVSGVVEGADGDVVFPGGTDWPVSTMLTAASGAAAADQWIEVDTANQFQALSSVGNGGLVVEGDWYIFARASAAGIVRKCSWVAGYRQGWGSTGVNWSEVNDGPDDIQSSQAAVVIESGEDVGFAWRALGYYMVAPSSGALAAGSHTVTIHPERTGIILVAVGAFANPEIASAISATSNHLTFSTVRTQTTDSVGWAQGRLFMATLDNFPIDTADPATVTVSWSTPMERIGFIVYEIANADSITASASTVRGTHLAGSADGLVSLSLSPAPTSPDVTLGFLIGSDAAVNDAGSDAGAGFTEELEVLGSTIMWVHAESRTASTSSTMGWADIDASTTPSAKDAIVFGVVVKPLADFAMWSSFDPLTIGGARDAFGGPIFSAIAKTADGTPIWEFDPSALGPH